MELRPPRGADDLLPPGSERMRALYEQAAVQARLHGYTYVETPAFEATELFARTSGSSSDVVRKEMYTFDDRGGRSLTLRPEGTAPVVRAFLANAHDLPSPFKAWYVEPMWRYGRPQSGRLREFRQFGLEALGVSDPAADVEVVAVGDAFLRGVGLSRLELQLNSIGDETCRPPYRVLLVDYLRSRRDRMSDEHRDRFEENPLRILDCKNPSCVEVAAEAPAIVDHLCEPCRVHLDSVRAGLERTGVVFVEAPHLVRGLDYYTRTAFEWVSAVLSEAQGSVGGGGRYDALAELLGGPPTPGVGFALGLERILLALEAEGVATTGDTIDCFLVTMGDGLAERGASVARSLREAGIGVSSPFESRSLKAQLRMADRSGARFALIIGEREGAAGTVTLRRLSDGHQEELGVDELVARILAEPKGKA